MRCKRLVTYHNDFLSWQLNNDVRFLAPKLICVMEITPVWNSSLNVSLNLDHRAICFIQLFNSRGIQEMIWFCRKTLYTGTWIGGNSENSTGSSLCWWLGWSIDMFGLWWRGLQTTGYHFARTGMWSAWFLYKSRLLHELDLDEYVTPFLLLTVSNK